MWTLSFLIAGTHLAVGISYFNVTNSDGTNNVLATNLCVIFILVYVALFEFSLGPIPWLYMAEIMTEKGLSIAVLLNWGVTLLMAIITQYIIYGETFIIFGFICMCCGFFSLFIMKETKGLTNQEVAKLYSKEKSAHQHLDYKSN